MPKKKKEKQKKFRGESTSAFQEELPVPTSTLAPTSAPTLPKKGEKLKRTSEVNDPKKTNCTDAAAAPSAVTSQASSSDAIANNVEEPLRSVSPTSDAEAETTVDRQRIAVLESQLPSTLYR